MSQLSALVLKAIERRTAISGLIPARRLRMLESVFRLTPSARAASVTVTFRGFRHSSWSTSPGCGGLCIFMVTSVVVLVVHAIGVLTGQCNRCRYGLQPPDTVFHSTDGGTRGRP